MQKELLTVEFRYRIAPTYDGDSGHITKTVTIGVFESLNKAVSAGNDALAVLAKKFQVRDCFTVKGLFGRPDRLVTNTCYPTNGVEYFAKITPLHFDALGEAMKEVCK